MLKHFQLVKKSKPRSGKKITHHTYNMAWTALVQNSVNLLLFILVQYLAKNLHILEGLFSFFASPKKAPQYKDMLYPDYCHQWPSFISLWLEWSMSQKMCCEDVNPLHKKKLFNIQTRADKQVCSLKCFTISNGHTCWLSKGRDLLSIVFCL